MAQNVPGASSQPSISGNVVAALGSRNTPGSDRHGIWRVTPAGAKELLAAMPAGTMPNSLVFGPDGALFVTDSAKGAIWRIGPDGAAAPWIEHEYLERDLQACPPVALNSAVGANGILIEPSGSMLVANTTKAPIVRVPVGSDGRPGTPIVAHGPDCERLAGADGIALDRSGNLFVALNWRDRLVRISPAGEIQAVATKADGLDFPASLAFGRGGLLLTNYAQLSYLNYMSPQPSLMTIDGR